MPGVAETMRLGGRAETTDVEDNTDVCCKRCWLTFIDVFGEFLVGLGKGDWVHGAGGPAQGEKRGAHSMPIVRVGGFGEGQGMKYPYYVRCEKDCWCSPH